MEMCRERRFYLRREITPAHWISVKPVRNTFLPRLVSLSPIWADIIIIQGEIKKHSSFFLKVPDLLLRSPWINRSIIAFSIRDVARCISAELPLDYAETMNWAKWLRPAMTCTIYLEKTQCLQTLSIAVRWKSLMCVDVCMLCYMCFMLSLAPPPPFLFYQQEKGGKESLFVSREKR